MPAASGHRLRNTTTLSSTRLFVYSQCDLPPRREQLNNFLKIKQVTAQEKRKRKKEEDELEEEDENRRGRRKKKKKKKKKD